jgi:hypothetical protein
MAMYEKRIIARKIRVKGKSIIYIAKKLGVTKSSVSLWCRDIILTSEQSMALQKQKGKSMGRWIGAESNRRKKRENILRNKKEAFSLLGKVSKRDLLIAGTCLFWGEGSKTGSRFIFINSDPVMIKIMKKFLIEILGVDKNDIRATIQINHIHKLRINKIMSFWSKYLNIPLESFSKPYYINVVPKKVYENYEVYNGILRLSVLHSSNLEYKMLGLIEAFQHSFMSA